MATNIIRDIEYLADNPNKSERHTLDLYLPEQMDTNALVPVVVHVHGGGWQRGNKTSEWRGGPSVGRAVSKAGMVVAVINYRLAPVTLTSLVFRFLIVSLVMSLIAWAITGFSFAIIWAAAFIAVAGCAYVADCFKDKKKTAQHPEMAKDIVRAIEWVLGNARRYCDKADTSGVFLTGHSAGGHLVSLVGTHPELLRDQGMDHSVIKGVVSMSGIFTMSNPWGVASWHPKLMFFRYIYLNSAVGTKPEQWEDASPSHHFHEHSPPFLFINAEADMGLEIDTKFMWEKSQRFVQQNDRAPHDEFHIVAGTDHGNICNRFGEEYGRHNAHVLVSTWIWKLHHLTPRTPARLPRNIDDERDGVSDAATTSSPRVAASSSASPKSPKQQQPEPQQTSSPTTIASAAAVAADPCVSQ